MGAYIYCVVPPDHAPSDLAGIDGGPVELRIVAGLGIWISEMDGVPGPTVDHIRQHNQVVEAAISDLVTPVPVRFGQWADSTATLEQTVAQRADTFGKLLSLFAGALEFGVRVLNPAPAEAQPVHPTGPAVSGRDYLASIRDRLMAQAPAEGIKQKIQSDLALLVKAERIETQQTPHAMVSFAHLVARQDFEAYRSRVQTLRVEMADLRFLVSGPWPPYSFAS